jgi:spermidine synthase
MLTSQAAVRSVCESFPYVRVFPSLEGWGIHILASRDPIEDVTPGELAARFPESAKNDLLEWAPDNNLTNYLGQMVSREASALDLEKFLNPDRGIQITDDRPYNEYFLMRKFNEWANQ